jgi:transposase
VVLQAWTGVQLTQGALTQDAWRRAHGPVGMAYEGWRAAVSAAPVVPTDETGWRVGGDPADLMAFETDLATVSQVRPRHRHEAVQEVSPGDDDGVLVTDRGRREDAHACADVQPQQCLAHILRSRSAVVATKTGRAQDFGDQLKALLQDALAWWHAYRDGQVTDVKADAEGLQAELTYRLRDRRLKDADHQRRLHELGWPHDRGQVLRFWVDPRIEPTTQRAERVLRPAVIARQVSHGSKNGRGAYAFAAFTSVRTTLVKRSADALVDNLSHLFQPPNLESVAP